MHPSDIPAFPAGAAETQVPLSHRIRSTRFAADVYASPVASSVPTTTASPPPSPPSTSPEGGWRSWHRVALNRLRGRTLSVSPGSNFAPAITLDMRVQDRSSPHQPAPPPPETALAWARVKVSSFVEEIQEWFLAALVGAATACSAAWIEFVQEHLADLRFGYCRGMFWLHRDFCCGSDSAVDLLGNRCLPATTAASRWMLPGEPEVNPDPFAPPSFLADPSGNLNTLTLTVDESATWVSWSSYVPHWPLSNSTFDVLLYVTVGTVLASMAAILCKRIAPAAGGSGIPELKTILGGFALPNVLSPWTLCTKIVGLAMAVASGLGLGKEGPMVHVGACWADVVSRLTLTPLDASKKLALLSAGSAAGVSTAFAAPVGGVLFALEEVSTYFPPSTLYKTLMCSIVASLVLKKVNPSGSGNGTVFQLDAIAMQGRWEIVELVPFILVAAAGGMIGAFFIWANVQIQTFRQRARRGRPTELPHALEWVCAKPVREVFLAGVIFGFLNYTVPMLRFSSTLLMKHMFTRCARDGIGFHDIYSLCDEVPGGGNRTTHVHNTSDEMLISLGIALVGYFINALVTLGLNLPAGLFIPCLTIGSLLGRIFGLMTIRLDHKYSFMTCRSCIHPGVYSLLGAVAVLGGVTRMTVSLVVIAFEMTGGLGYIVPFMLVTLIARWTAEYFVEPSVYDWYIRLKRLPFLHLTPHKSDHEVVTGRCAADVMDRDIVCIALSQHWTLAMARTLVGEFQYSTYPVVSDAKSKMLVGTVKRRRLLERLNLLTVQATKPITTPSSSSARLFSRTQLLQPPSGFSGRTPLRFGLTRDEDGIDFTDLVERVPIQVSPLTSLIEVHQIFLQLGLSHLLFTEQGSLKGILTKKAFLSRLERLRGSAV